jgi:hypothetical protein
MSDFKNIKTKKTGRHLASLLRHFMRNPAQQFRVLNAMNEELNSRAQEAKAMMKATLSDDQRMKRLRDELHKMTAQELFEIFPFLPDDMEPHEIRHLGERINRHLFNLTEELKNFSYS